MYKKQPLKKRQNKKIYAKFYIENKLLVMPFTIKTKQKNKVQGSLDTTTLDTLLAPPPPALRRSIVLNDSNKRELKEKKKKKEGMRKAHNVPKVQKKLNFLSL